MINKTRNGIIGFLLGSLVGAVTMLLFAPQSGKQTRADIQLKSMQMRDQTTDMVKKEFAEIRLDAHNIKENVHEKTEQLKGLGQEKLVEQMVDVSNALDVGIMAVEAA
jgi:gas vesicle protein